MHGRLLAMFAASTTVLALAFFADDVPFAKAPGALANLSEILYFLVLAGMLLLCGRLVGSTLTAPDE
jgi:hypothetical protein